MEFGSNSKLDAQEGSALLKQLLYLIPIEDIAYNVVKFIGLWIVGWYVIYWISGLYVTSISINNGILFNGILYRGKRVDISMDSLRFRLWGNSRKIILDNAKVRIKRREHTAGTTKTKLNSAQQKRMSIFSRNPIIRSIERILLNNKPNIYVDLKNLTVIYPSEDMTEIKYIQLGLESTKIKVDQEAGVVNLTLSITANHIEHFDKQFLDQKKSPCLILDVAKFETSICVNYDGDVSKIRLKVFTDELQFLVFRALQGRLSKAEYGEITSDNERAMLERSKLEDLQKRDPFDKLLSFYGFWYPVLEELVVRVENTKLQHIPLMTTDRNVSYKEILELSKEHLVHLDVGLKLFSLNGVKLHKESAGYELLFNENDDPLNSNLALQSLTATFFNKEKESGASRIKEKEILYVSNFIATYKSNLIDKISKLQSFRDCNSEIYSTASSPLIDLDTNQVALLIYNGFLLSSYMKLRKLRQTNRAQSENIKENSLSNEEKLTEGYGFQNSPSPSRNRRKVLKFLEDYLPKFEAKIAIELPRIVIRRKISSIDDPQALCFSNSLIDFQVSTTSTSTSNEYDIVCRFSNPCLKYMFDSGKDSFFKRLQYSNETVFNMSSFQITSKFFNNFTSKVLISARNPTLNLGHIKVFLGISDLLKEILKTTEHQYRSSLMIMQLIQAISIEKSSFQDPEYGYQQTNRKSAKGEKTLPQWLAEATLDITGFSLVLGSRSVLMEKDQMLSIGEHSDMDANFGLRSTKVSLKKGWIHIKNKESNQEQPSHLVEARESWSSETSLHSLDISTKSTFDRKEKFKSFLSIAQLKVMTGVHNYVPIPKFDISISSDTIDGTYDNFKLFTFLGSIHLIKNAILEPASQIKQKVASIVKGSDDPGHSQIDSSRGTGITDMIKLQLTIGKVDIAAFLHNDFKVKLQLFHIRTSIADDQLSFNVDFLRLLSESPHTSSLWARLACVDFISSRFHLERPTYIPINLESIRVIQHHRLVVYKIFDNFSITLKVAKQLIKDFKSEDKKETVVKPSASRISRFPDIRLRSKKLGFSAEDDPFECDLAMSFQLGLVEQRKRIKLYEEFEDRVAFVKRDSGDIPIDHQKQLYLLEKGMSASWIQMVKTYKKKMNREIFENRDFLFGYEASLPKKENKDIVAYMVQAPLLSLFMMNLDLHLAMPKFPLEEIPQFIHTFGQGVPTTSEYSMLAPFHINLSMSEMRMHLRDYPIPLLYVPPKQDKNDKTFFMSGHLVVCEELLRAKEQLRVINIPLVSDYNESDYEHYLLTLQKSLSSIKIYTDLGVKFQSNHITRISWSPSYLFGIQQVMLSLDEFSKPPIDPSMKLGFWDKLRFVLHGRCVIDSEVGIEVAFKGSRDPYDIVGTASGFTFSLRDKIRWTINEKNDPQLFFDIKAGNVSWNIPDFVGAPLLSWSRESSKFTFLLHSGKPVLSCFAYFLNPYEMGNIAIELSKAKEVEKQVFSLEKVQFRAGFKLQRRASNDLITNTSKPHYQVRLCNPIFAEKGHDSYAGFRTDFIHMILSLNASGENGYNCLHLTPTAFEQFFNWWKLFSGNMLLPIRRGPLFDTQKNSMKFSQHLFSNTFKFNVKSLFISHTYRDNESGTENNTLECLGIKAKMSNFLVDLHQRKEPRIEINEGLCRNKEIMKMNFNSGEVHLNRIEIRTMHAFFEEILSNSESSKPIYETFDHDIQWFDVSDFEEAFVPSLSGRRKKISLHPLLYSERFSYLRHTNDEVFNRNDAEKVDDQDFEDEPSKETGIQKLQVDMFHSRLNQLQQNIEPSKLEEVDNESLRNRILFVKRQIHENRMKMKAQTDGVTYSTNVDNDKDFHNKFILISMLLKWNHTNRNLIYKYVHFVQLKLNYSKSISFDAIRSLEKLIQKSRNGLRLSGTRKSVVDRNAETKSLSSDKRLSAENRQSRFDDIIYDIDEENETLSSDFLVDIKYPQIQLESEDSPNSVILISAPEIDAKIISVFKKSEDEAILSGTELEKRYGVLLHDSNIFVLNKDDIQKSGSIISSDVSYGSLTNWPPWVGIEVCMDAQLAGKDKLVVEKSSMMITYKQIRSKLSADEKNLNTEMGNTTGENRTSKTGNTLSSILDVDIPKFAVFSTSKQCHTLFSMASSLLFYSEPMNQDLQDKLNRLKFSVNLQDLDVLYQKILELHKLYRLTIFLSKPYEIKKSSLSRKELQEFLKINSDKADLNTEMYLMNRSLLLGDSLNADSSTNPVSQWNIRVDQIILHMLEDSRVPILDFAMAHGTFTRVIKEDGSNSNKLGIEMMQGFNFISHANSPLFLSPIKQQVDQHSDKIINIWWDMMRSIGGIRVIKNFLIDSQPLHINFDEVTGQKLLEYFLLDDDNDIKLSGNIKGKSNDVEINKKGTNLDKSEKKENRLSGEPDVSLEEDKTQNSRRNTPQIANKKSKSLLRKQTSFYLQEEHQDDVEDMLVRARKYLSIVVLRINPIHLLISIKLKGYRSILNVQELAIELPEFVLSNRIMSPLEISSLLKKMVIRSLIAHIGKVLRNKMSRKELPESFALLEQLQNYENFIDIFEKVKGSGDTDNNVNK